MKPYSQMKYGLFVHYVYELARYSDGSAPESIDAFADGFHVEAFADSVQRMGVEYLILTAWHYRMRPLYPSAVTERWRPGNICKRKLSGGGNLRRAIGIIYRMGNKCEGGTSSIRVFDLQ